VLLDEPFSGLDGQLKAEVRDTTLAALRDAGATALIVTHDAEEAMMMADDLALMQAGRILQTGSPRDCYLKPVSPDAALLLGDANLLPAEVKDGWAVTPFGALACALDGLTAVVVARPEGLRLSGEGAAAKVASSRFAGPYVMLTIEAAGAAAVCRVSLKGAPEPGAAVRVGLDPDFCTAFPAPIV
jgi:iron(III) transport system ATP-binding protein